MDAILICVWLVVHLMFIIWTRHECQKQGIWDGAFNQSLPHVQKAMIDYRPQEALDLLVERNIPITQEVLDYAAWEHHAFPRNKMGVRNRPPSECPHGDNYDDCPDCRH